MPTPDHVSDLMDAAAEPSLEAMRAAFEKIEKHIRMEFAEEIILAHIYVPLTESPTVHYYVFDPDRIRRLANPGKEGE